MTTMREDIRRHRPAVAAVPVAGLPWRPIPWPPAAQHRLEQRGGRGGPSATSSAASGRSRPSDWERAAAFLERAAEADARNADVFNLLAYSYRHLEPTRRGVRALMRGRWTLDPRHLGAHEYVGEAYLLVGDLARAEHHLAALTEICASCEETEELAEAIAQFREGGAEGAAEDAH